MYALIDPQDGREPSYRLIREAAEAQPGEVVVEQQPPPGSVWEAASKRLRPRTDAENLAVAKEAKRAELHAAFARECEADFGATPWVAIAVLASSPTDARVTSLKTRATKLRDRLAAVDGATTVAGVEGVRW